MDDFIAINPTINANGQSVRSIIAEHGEIGRGMNAVVEKLEIDIGRGPEVCVSKYYPINSQKAKAEIALAQTIYAECPNPEDYLLMNGYWVVTFDAKSGPARYYQVFYPYFPTKDLSSHLQSIEEKKKSDIPPGEAMLNTNQLKAFFRDTSREIDYLHSINYAYRDFYLGNVFPMDENMARFVLGDMDSPEYIRREGLIKKDKEMYANTIRCLLLGEDKLKEMANKLFMQSNDEEASLGEYYDYIIRSWPIFERGEMIDYDLNAVVLSEAMADMGYPQRLIDILNKFQTNLSADQNQGADFKELADGLAEFF